MSSQTRIVILKMRNLVYTGIFIFLVLVLGVLLYLMFGRQTETAGDSSSPAVSVIQNAVGQSASDTVRYSPGCYYAVVNLGEYSVNVQVTVNADSIESVQLSDIPEGISDAYPLLEPAMADLSEKILSSQSTEGLNYKEGMQYTQTALTDAVNTALLKAAGSR